jgi:hypothetical protein
MKRIPVICIVDLERFTAKLVLPIDMTATEAWSLAAIVLDQQSDPSEGAKFAVSDPTICPDVTI